jgi:hypothetical protein
MSRCSLLISFILMGCAVRTTPNIEVFGEVTDASGDNKLIHRVIERPHPKPEHGRKAFDFHSLAWEVRAGDAWTQRVVISQKEFERDGPRRWVSELYSLDPAAGTAIIKVGEELPPDALGVVHVEYSWREWVLVGNREIRKLRVCTEPFEPFEAKTGDR